MNALATTSAETCAKIIATTSLISDAIEKRIVKIEDMCSILHFVHAWIYATARAMLHRNLIRGKDGIFGRDYLRIIPF